MATYVNGTNMVLSVDDTATAGTSGAVTYTAIAAAQNCTLSVDVDAPEITVKADNDQKAFTGLSTSWTVEADGLYNEDSTVEFRSLWNAAYGNDSVAGVSPIIDGYPRRVKIKFLGQTGGNYYEGYGYITSISASGGTEDAASFSVSIQGTGDLSYTAS